MTTSSNGRRTIGVLVGWQVFHGTLHSFLNDVLRGVRAEAETAGCNVLLACGVGHAASSFSIQPAWPVPSHESDFLPVGPWNTDALIVILPLLSAARSQDVQQMIAQGHPVIFVGAGEDGPSVVPDNAGGIRQAVDHLVAHGHRRIAFIAGEADHAGDSGQRLVAYRAALRAHGLPDAPELVAYGFHTFDGAHLAMERMLASENPFTAVIGSNDENAVGALRALRQAGRRVPEDIAVLGFDDRLEALLQSPPLTTVRYPAYEAGGAALSLALQAIEAPLDKATSVTIPTHLVIRQSCGCVHGASAGSPLSASRPGQVAGGLDQIAAAVERAVIAQLRHLPGEQTAALCRALVDAFQDALETGEAAKFYQAMETALAAAELAKDRSHAWQAAISVLADALQVWSQEVGHASAASRAMDMLDQARIMVSASVERQYQGLYIDQAEIAERSGVLAARFFASLDETQVLRALEDGLPGIGIRHGRMAFYEANEDDAVAWSVVHRGTEPTRVRFRSREFPPPGLYPPDQPFHLALLPLIASNTVEGFVAFDATNLSPCVTIMRQLEAGLTGARLHAAVHELSLTDDLTGLHNRRYLELVLQNEIERCLRYNRDLAVVMLDIDSFKDYNDSFGHLAGDEALRQVGRAILQVRRGSDVLVRFGGEEFVLILPETQAQGAAVVAEHVRAAVSGLSDLPRPLRISAGVAATRFRTEKEVVSLMQRADHALYQAKRAGRDRVCVYNDGELHEPVPFNAVG